MIEWTDSDLATVIEECEAEAAGWPADDLMHAQVAFLRELQARRAADETPAPQWPGPIGLCPDGTPHVLHWDSKFSGNRRYESVRDFLGRPGWWSTFVDRVEHRASDGAEPREPASHD